MPRDSARMHRQSFKLVDEAYRAGDLAALKAALGHPENFPNCLQPHDLGVGDYPMEYAIYWSPLHFIIELIEAIHIIGALVRWVLNFVHWLV